MLGRISLRTMSLDADGSAALTEVLAKLNDGVGSLAEIAAELSGGELNLRRLIDEILRAASAIRIEVDEAALALKILESGQPLAASFPDGRPAPPILSPRQVMYLASLGGPS